jgi:hypothetical protein
MPGWVRPWLCLSALGIGVLLSLQPVFLLVEAAATNGLTPGIATLIAAAVGFSAVVLQTRVGFRNLIKSQEMQAQINREAREHQAALSRRERTDQQADEKRALAAALCGELGAAYDKLRTGKDLMQMQKLIYEAAPKTVMGTDLGKISPQFEPRIFSSSIDKLGLLGPSTAGDVVMVYQLLLWDPGSISSAKLNGEMLGKILDVQIKVVDGWLEDNVHVNKRLLAILLPSNEDPGPLFFSRQKRRESGAVA